MKTIAVIGQGRVGTHLCVALMESGVEVISVNSRTLEELPPDADLFIIAVSDSAIEQVAARLPTLTGIVVHTSGSVLMDALAPYAENYGVFYPLQTFTKGATLDYGAIPVFIEANNASAEERLRQAAVLFTNHVYHADSDRRAKLHIASVFACNYANLMWNIADNLLRDEGLSLEILQPLIEASTAKLRHLSPAEAQTGPAVRGDRGVVEKHIEALKGTSYSEIYEMLANQIMKNKEK